MFAPADAYGDTVSPNLRTVLPIDEHRLGCRWKQRFSSNIFRNVDALREITELVLAKSATGNRTQSCVSLSPMNFQDCNNMVLVWLRKR